MAAGRSSTPATLIVLLGAPVALEDHAYHACLAAPAIQEEPAWLAAEVSRRDGVALQLRIGLDSGRVIAGDVGSWSWMARGPCG